MHGEGGACPRRACCVDQDSQRRGLCRQARQGQRHTAALCFAKALALCPAPTADELVRPARMRRPQGVGAAAVPPLGSNAQNFGHWYCHICACLQEGEASISAAAASDVCTSALYSGALQALLLGRPRIALRCFQARPPYAQHTAAWSAYGGSKD